MKYNTVFRRESKWILIYPKFEQDTPKEKKIVLRMNDIFGAMEKHISAYAESSSFPEGAKYFAECVYLEENSNIKCEFVLKLRGRTARRTCIVYTLEKGYIIDTEII